MIPVAVSATAIKLSCQYYRFTFCAVILCLVIHARGSDEIKRCYIVNKACMIRSVNVFLGWWWVTSGEMEPLKKMCLTFFASHMCCSVYRGCHRYIAQCTDNLLQQVHQNKSYILAGIKKPWHTQNFICFILSLEVWVMVYNYQVKKQCV